MLRLIYLIIRFFKQGCILRNAIVNDALEQSLSRERLGKYLADCGGDLDTALALYEEHPRR